MLSSEFTTQLLTADFCHPNLDFNIRLLNDFKIINLQKTYNNKVLLIVNTASQCVFTPQLGELQALYQHYQQAGLVVLGFPSNDFGAQESKTEAEIEAFCQSHYGIQFPMFEKMAVAKEQAHPLYQYLANLSGSYPRWNFHKYLLDRQGRMIGDYSSWIKPHSKKLLEAIEEIL